MEVPNGQDGGEGGTADGGHEREQQDHVQIRRHVLYDLQERLGATAFLLGQSIGAGAVGPGDGRLGRRQDGHGQDQDDDADKLAPVGSAHGEATPL